jgi:hypothetical protein
MMAVLSLPSCVSRDADVTDAGNMQDDPVPADNTRDRGMVTAFVVVFATALVLVSGLVVDGGRMLAEHRKVNNLADSAARAGAQAISGDAFRSGDMVNVLIEDEARELACGLLASASGGGDDYSCGNGSTVQVAGNQVTVTVNSTIDMLLLAGGNQAVQGEGTACVAVGVDQSITC